MTAFAIGWFVLVALTVGIVFADRLWVRKPLLPPSEQPTQPRPELRLVGGSKGRKP